MDAIRALLEKDWTVSAANENRLVVHDSNSRAYVYTATSGAPQHQQNHGLLLDYSSVKLAKAIVERIANSPSLIVDNDFGTVLPGDEFVARCKKNKMWDWRHNSIKPDI